MANLRTITFWFTGAICIFFGSLIAGSVEPSALGATTTSVILAYIIAFILVLLGGMFWVATSVISIEES